MKNTIETRVPLTWSNTQCGFCKGVTTVSASESYWSSYGVEELCVGKDNRMAFEIPGAEKVSASISPGGHRVEVRASYGDEADGYEVRKFFGMIQPEYRSQTPKATYYRGVLTLEWEEPESTTVPIKLMD